MNIIAGGLYHTLCIDVDGCVWSCGNNDDGQQGHYSSNPSASLLQENNIERLSIIPTLKSIVFVACGNSYSMCIDNTGSLWAFGANDKGQLGLKNRASVFEPKQVQGLPPIISVACSSNHTACIDSTNSVWTFGSNQYEKLGLGVSGVVGLGPHKVPSDEMIQKVALGDTFSAFLNFNGKLMVCGHLAICERIGNFSQMSIFPNHPNIYITDICTGKDFVVLLSDEGKVFYLQAYSQKSDSTFISLDNMQPLPEISQIFTSTTKIYCVDVDDDIWIFEMEYFEEESMFCKRLAKEDTFHNKIIAHSNGALNTTIVDYDSKIYVFSNHNKIVNMRPYNSSFQPNIYMNSSRTVKSARF